MTTTETKATCMACNAALTAKEWEADNCSYCGEAHAIETSESRLTFDDVLQIAVETARDGLKLIDTMADMFFAVKDEAQPTPEQRREQVATLAAELFPIMARQHIKQRVPCVTNALIPIGVAVLEDERVVIWNRDDLMWEISPLPEETSLEKYFNAVKGG